uniref:Fibronectin type-III domain-containing protein n=1 Tax=Oryzias melastigma TaxID=30732 RepID=A0A3B3BEZ7_ORYME
MTFDPQNLWILLAFYSKEICLAPSHTSITLQWDKVEYNVNFVLTFEDKERNISTLNEDGPVQITISSLTAATTYTFTLFSLNDRCPAPSPPKVNKMKYKN